MIPSTDRCVLTDTMDATLTMKRSFWFLEAAGGGRQFWVAPLPIPVIWALLHGMTPREGFNTER